jgi:serine/threonine-protein kinase
VTAAADGREPPSDPRIGLEVAERYRLVRQIGRGGMGAVFEAVHVVTGRRLAVKMLHPGLGRIPEIARRFEREARAVSRLTHPNIVSVVDFGAMGDGTLYLVMELLGGRSLAKEAKQPLPAPRALAILRQVLEALAHAHDQGVVHRDLKPDNIMLVDAGASAEERDIVKLLDFGIAKLVGEARARGDDTLTQVGVAFGTPDYMAPEQALGEAVDARADLYAVGVIAYELLCGARPFVSDDKVAVLRMHVALEPPRLDDARHAPALRELLGRALEKRPQDRFQSAQEMLRALDAAAGDRSHPPAAPPAHHARGVAVVLAALALGLAVLGYAVLTPGRRGPAPTLPIVAPARQLLASGDPAGALALLEPAVSGPLARDPDAWLALGSARDKLGRGDDALEAYQRALALADSTDPDLRTFCETELGPKPRRARRGLACLELLPHMGAPGLRLLGEQASRQKAAPLRARARDLAAGAGAPDVDLVASFTLDLEQGATCEERKEAVTHLRALRDKRALAALRKARGRRGGFLGLDTVNACLDREAAEAIDFLNALP